MNAYEPADGHSKIGEFPINIDIELTNCCNMNCLMCPTGTGISKRPHGYLEKSIYQKVLQEADGKDTAFRFIRWGEPLLHPQAAEFIAAAKEKGILCHINTNGSLLDAENIRRLLDTGLDSIKFSFQGVDAQSYSEMRQRGDYHKLLDAISLLHRLRGRGGAPYIHIGTTITYESEKAVESFKNEVSGICDLVTVGKTSMENVKDLANANLNEKQKTLLYSLKDRQTLHKVRYRCCPDVFGKLSVDWDGRVTACCNDYDGEMILGNIQNDTLADLYNHNQQLYQYRKLLSRRDYDAIPRCSRCYDYNSFQTAQ
jgi:radical SAM protein with 4Fe4S-binding SPASM domain